MLRRTVEPGALLAVFVLTVSTLPVEGRGGGRSDEAPPTGRTFTEVATLGASDAGVSDNLGGAVAISGDTAIVGATGEDGGDGNPLAQAGAAYVFQFLEGVGWLQIAKLTASDRQAEDRFGIAVGISGDLAIVGAQDEDGGENDPLAEAGAAYVFGRDVGGTSNWGQIAKLTAGDAQAEDRFGSSVAIFGDTAIVGACCEDGGDGDPRSDAGALYVFGQDVGGPNNFGQVAKLTAGDAQASDFFGVAAISGDTVVVGAQGEDGGEDDPLAEAGAAYVFERDAGGPGSWGEVAKLTASDAQAGDRFGDSLAISGDTVIVGSRDDGGAGDPLADAGAAYVFDRDEGGADAWGQAAKLTAADPQEDDGFGGFGDSVAISGDTALIAAASEDGGPGDPLGEAGAAYVFGRDHDGKGNWGQVVKLAASDAQTLDFFGASVGISGSVVIVGATSEDGGPGDPAPGSGTAYVFEESFLQFLIAEAGSVRREPGAPVGAHR